MKYKLSRQYQQGPAVPSANFSDLADARLFVEAKLELDQRTGLRAVYRLYNEAELVEQWPRSNLFTQDSDANAQRARSALTPLSTSPRPPGFPVMPRDEDQD